MPQAGVFRTFERFTGTYAAIFETKSVLENVDWDRIINSFDPV